MRTISKGCIATAVALAFASSAALAQTLTVRPGTTTTTSGSTVTTSTSNTTPGGAVTGGVNSSAPSETIPGAGAGGNVGSSGVSNNVNTTTTSGVASREPIVTGDASLTGRVTPNNPTAAATGSALGRSPGQTSSGTFAGNSSPGITPFGDTSLGTVFAGQEGTTGLPGGTSVGGVGVLGFGTTDMATAGGSVTANGERSGSPVFTGQANPNMTPTPLFNATAAQGAAREARRRARGEEPRIFGIAPRTDRDLTHQMRDDPIIRY